MRQSYHAEIRRSLSSPREISKQFFPANSKTNGNLGDMGDSLWDIKKTIGPTITIDNLLIVGSDHEESPSLPNSESSSVADA